MNWAAKLPPVVKICRPVSPNCATRRHWNFAQNFTKICGYTTWKPVQKSCIPSNWDRYFDITSLVTQQRALLVFSC